MWSEIRANGKVKYSERYEHPLTGKQLRVSITLDKDTRTNRKLAQTVLQEKISAKKLELCSTQKEKELTLSELVNLYLQDQALTVRQSTYSRNHFACKSLMRILGEDTLVERLNAGYVRKQLATQQESPGTTNERITRLKALIRWGFNNDYIADIHWVDKLSKLNDEEKRQKLEDKFLESCELQTLLKEMDDTKWRLLTEFQALSGLRCGEVIALESPDINLSTRYISVTKTFDPVNKIVNYPKTSYSTREVYMQDELFELCKRINLHFKTEQFATGCRTSLFFSDINGNHINYYSYNKYLGENAERLIHKKITTHFMRHTHVALMAEQGVPLDLISRRLGHSNSKITREIYFHVTEKMKERDNQQIKNIKIL